MKWLILRTIALATLLPTRLVSAQGLLYTVTSTGDGGLVGSDTFCDDGTGHCTLRAAIEASNSHPGTDGIDFDIPTTDPGFDPDTGIWTINLTEVLPDISDEVGITGPGADVLTVRRDTGGDYRIFNVTIVAGITAFSGLTISNGLAIAANGGGILISSSGATVNVINCVLSGNTALVQGGAIFNEGELNVTNSTFDANTAGF